jgi:hypothetical protein
MSETLTLRIEITFDGTGPRDAIEALRDITSGVEQFIGDYYMADDATEEGAPKRADGWQGPFVTKADGEIH